MTCSCSKISENLTTLVRKLESKEIYWLNQVTRNLSTRANNPYTTSDSAITSTTHITIANSTNTVLRTSTAHITSTSIAHSPKKQP